MRYKDRPGCRGGRHRPSLLRSGERMIKHFFRIFISSAYSSRVEATGRVYRQARSAQRGGAGRMRTEEKGDAKKKDVARLPRASQFPAKLLCTARSFISVS